MTSRATDRRTLLTAFVDYLVEPVEASTGDRGWGSPSASCRPSVAVVGLGALCGTTTLARALGVELALRDPEGAAVVTSATVPAGGSPLGTASAGRLERQLVRRLPLRARVSGRVCLVDGAERPALTAATRDLAPLVLDIDDPADAPIAASLVDVMVIVAIPRLEPSMGRLLAASLARVGPQPLIVLNLSRATVERWEGHCALCLPESRIGARFSLAGREARGPLGTAVSRLADLVEAAV